ncbi:MAG: hypothetical protein ACE5GK_06065 [Nitrospiria bacterium]
MSARHMITIMTSINVILLGVTTSKPLSAHEPIVMISHEAPPSFRSVVL